VTDRAPYLPWTPEWSRLAVRGRVIVKVASGEAPDRVPHTRDVAVGREVAPTFFDGGGRVDSTILRFSPALRVTRVFRPREAGSVRRPGWDGVEDDTGLSRTFRIDLDGDADLVALLQELADLVVVESACPQYLAVTPFAAPAVAEPAEDRWYAHRMIGAAEALSLEPGDSALITGVVDSGADLRHPELQQKLRPGVDTVDMAGSELPRSVRLLGDIEGRDRIAQDLVGHGTACAAIIGGKGINIPQGLGGETRVLPARALAGAKVVGRTSLTALGTLTDIDLALKLAIDLQARVVNCSFGTPESALRDRDPRPHADIVSYARRRGCTLVAASGNSGDRSRSYPACLDGVIAVGSVGPEGRPSGFSTRGDHVDLCAPGERVPSASVGGYGSHTGTSFAAPFVTGACALLLARAARLSESAEPDLLREVVMSSARPFGRGVDADGCGTGILDVPAALRLLERRLAGDGEASREREPAGRTEAHAMGPSP
jgi:subtilisin family serine protease